MAVRVAAGVGEDVTNGIAVARGRSGVEGLLVCSAAREGVAVALGSPTEGWACAGGVAPVCWQLARTSSATKAQSPLRVEASGARPRPWDAMALEEDTAAQPVPLRAGVVSQLREQGRASLLLRLCDGHGINST